MNRTEYMNALEKRLRILPKENFNEAMDYFTEYFEDAGPEREQQAIQDLGQAHLKKPSIMVIWEALIQRPNR